MKLGGSPITVMLDDGAEVSLIRRDVAIKLQHSKTVEWEEGIITGSTPGSRQVNGAVKTDLVIGGKTYNITLGIVEKFTYKGLLGIKVLRGAMKAILNLEKNTITPKNGFPVKIEEERTSKAMVVLGKKMIIPAETVRYLPMEAAKKG